SDPAVGGGARVVRTGAAGRAARLGRRGAAGRRRPPRRARAHRRPRGPRRPPLARVGPVGGAAAGHPAEADRDVARLAAAPGTAGGGRRGPVRPPPDRALPDGAAPRGVRRTVGGPRPRPRPGRRAGGARAAQSLTPTASGMPSSTVRETVHSRSCVCWTARSTPARAASPASPPGDVRSKCCRSPVIWLPRWSLALWPPLVALYFSGS